MQRVVSVVLMISLLASQGWATCGGGGGGGMGGMSRGADMSGNQPNQQTYPVPWKIVQPTDPPPKDGLAVYWLPSSQAELEKSSLRFSQLLSDYATQCVTLGIVSQRTPLGQKLAGDDKLPVAVLAEPDGTTVGKVENKNGFLYVEQVEKLLQSEMKRRDSALKERMEGAKSMAKAGDNPGAIAEYRAVLEQKCLFPKRAKDAAKELKKLGVTEVAEVPDGVNFDPTVMRRVAEAMRQGLEAENNANYTQAGRLYQAAHRMDPADPAPLRYLGELYRHHIGDWEKARQTFDAILAMRADSLSRAVALHGLGKMTIHEGEFQKGLALMKSKT